MNIYTHQLNNVFLYLILVLFQQIIISTPSTYNRGDNDIIFDDDKCGQCIG